MFIINKFKKHYFLLLSTFLFLYIFFNLFDGERGLISYFEKKEIYLNMLIEKNNLSSELGKIEHKITLISDKIDLDYIETLIREKLFLGTKKEEVYLIKNEN